jgi:hypothetical protein
VGSSSGGRIAAEATPRLCMFRELALMKIRLDSGTHARIVLCIG